MRPGPSSCQGRPHPGRPSPLWVPETAHTPVTCWLVASGPRHDPLVALPLIYMFSTLLGAIVLRPTLRYVPRRAASEISGVRWREPT